MPRRHGIDLIAQTTIIRVEQIGVGILVGVGCGLTGKELAVEQPLIESLVVHSRVGHNRVGRHLTRVRPPFGINSDLRIFGVASAGSDKHDTVGATRTIEGVAGSVFEDGNRLNIIVVERGNRVVVGRHTIHYIERGVAGVDRADTTDTNLGNRARCTIDADTLHAGYLTRKGVADIAGLALNDVVGLDYRSRTSERLLRGRTKGYDHNFVYLLAVLGKGNLQPVCHREFHRLHTNERNYERLSRLGGD